MPYWNDMREILRVPTVWAKHHFSKLKNLITFAIGDALNRHAQVDLCGTKMEVIAFFSEGLKLPDKEIAPRRIEANLKLTILVRAYRDTRLHIDLRHEAGTCSGKAEGPQLSENSHLKLFTRSSAVWNLLSDYRAFPSLRHCERSEAIQGGSAQALDCFATLAMTNE